MKTINNNKKTSLCLKKWTNYVYIDRAILILFQNVI
uniref:Uncharacterized protein n=1 Tax=Lepeophtheirus salmonis TaxID=72036 RepID=A0A0K2V1F1_LEPSM